MQSKVNTSGKKIDRKAAIGTVLFYMVLLVLLYFFGFRSLIPDSEEGVLIAEGITLTGGGRNNPEPPKTTPSSTAATSVPVAASTPPAVAPTPVESQEDLKTQTFDDEAPVVVADEKPKVKPKQTDPDAERKKAEEEALRKKQKAEEEARLKKEKEAALERERQAEEKRKQEEAERKRKEQIQRELAQLDQDYASKAQSTSSSSNLFNPNEGTSEASGKGTTSFPGKQGSPNGDPKSTSTEGTGLGKSGNSFSLEGRSLSGALPEPTYNIQEEGTVVVEIVVDRNGKVIGATPKLKGSTTQNPELWRVAKEAALKARFNSDAGAAEKQVGSITYHFRLD